MSSAPTTAAERPAIAPLLAVSDLSRSILFYTLALGATVVEHLPHYALLASGGSRLHLAVTGPPPSDRPDVPLVTPTSHPTGLLVLAVDDCAAEADRLVLLGAQRLGESSVPPWGGERRCFLVDPDGHLLELNEVLPED